MNVLCNGPSTRGYRAGLSAPQGLRRTRVRAPPRGFEGLVGTAPSPRTTADPPAVDSGPPPFHVRSTVPSPRRKSGRGPSRFTVVHLLPRRKPPRARGPGRRTAAAARAAREERPSAGRGPEVYRRVPASRGPARETLAGCLKPTVSQRSYEGVRVPGSVPARLASTRRSANQTRWRECGGR